MEIKGVEHYNLGTINKNRVRIITDTITFDLTFSYNTLVGISYIGTDFNGKYLRSRSTIKNQWSVTTGKLLNELEPDKNKREEPDEFKRSVTRMFEQMNLVEFGKLSL